MEQLHGELSETAVVEISVILAAPPTAVPITKEQTLKGEFVCHCPQPILASHLGAACDWHMVHADLGFPLSPDQLGTAAKSGGCILTATPLRICPSCRASVPLTAHRPFSVFVVISRDPGFP